MIFLTFIPAVVTHILTRQFIPIIITILRQNRFHFSKLLFYVPIDATLNKNFKHVLSSFT